MMMMMMMTDNNHSSNNENNNNNNNKNEKDHNKVSWDINSDISSTDNNDDRKLRVVAFDVYQKYSKK